MRSYGMFSKEFVSFFIKNGEMLLNVVVWIWFPNNKVKYF